MATTINSAPWMEWVESLLGGVSRQTLSATSPPDRFFCLLDELPLHLIPQPARRLLQAAGKDQSLFLNPMCQLAAAEEIPEEIPPELVFGFALHGTIAWVRDARNGSLLPFWLGSEIGAFLRSLPADEPVPSSVPPSITRVLAAAGILITKESLENSRRSLELEKAALLFQRNGYAPLASLIHPFHVAALRRYYRHQIRSGAIRLGDGQSQRRYCAHNEPVARFFHYQLARTLSAVAGETLKPSYVYLASYLSGAELKKHTDREQCEFSITFCLDFSPEPEVATPWPISLDTATGSVTVYQALGDGLAYRGTRLPHYRSPLPQGQTSTSIFFHYVPEDFAGSLT